MKPQNHHHRILIALIFVAGFIGAAISSWKLFCFVGRITRNDSLSISQWIRELIIPHSILIISLAVIATGIILSIRHAVIRKRMHHE